MKKKSILFSTASAIIFFALASCSKMEQPQSSAESSETASVEGNYIVTFECSMADDTRTEFHDKAIWWSEGDMIRFYQRFIKEGASAYTNGYADRTVSSCCEAYSTTINFTKPGKFPAYYFALYPQSSIVTSWTTLTDKEGCYTCMTIPSEQHPTETNFDPAADVLISEYLTAPDTQMKDFNLRFRRPVAFGKMKIVGIPSNSPISKVDFSNNKKYIAGSFYFGLDNIDCPGHKSGTEKLTISLVYDTPVTIDPTSGMTAYFCCYPFELGSGDSFTVKVITKAGEVFEKDVSLTDAMIAKLGGSFKLAQSRATQFTVDMSTAFKPTCKAASISPISFTTNSIGIKFTGKEDAGITAVKYMLLERSAFEKINDIAAYVSEKESTMSSLSSANVTKLNNGETVNSGSYQRSTMKEYVAIAKVSTSEGSDILTVVIPSSWISISCSTSSTSGGKITIKFIGKDVKSIKYLIATTTEVGSTKPETYFNNNESKSSALKETNIPSINDAGDTGKAYNFTVSNASTTYVVMIKATNTSGETQFMYQTNVTSSGPAQ